ncbi:cilia- and flagella-associated protein 70 [Nasonia vitripennis]|uniref:Uncharacterized protein n=1 Tax=Nasonia vitripennis TaxID=7425 RepID=A0A7M7H262_NASVI|nr:cilia- and flagella-associated protein 70 [Nasonia vitripennis]
MEESEIEQRDISFASQNSASDLLNEEGEESQPKIEITINSIENIIKNNTLPLKISLEHEDTILGESEIIRIDATYDNPTKLHYINFTVGLRYEVNNLRSVSSIVSTPVLIKVFEISNNTNLPRQSLKANSNEKLQGDSRRSSKNEVKILGMCNVDLLPVVLGETVCDEKLVLELPSYSWDGNTTAWANLPRISLTMRLNEPDAILKEKDFNILNITVESIYNPPSICTEEMEYKCGTVLYTDNPVEESCIIFEAGKWTNFHDVEKTKSWGPLQNLESRARFSKYKIHHDYESVKSAYKKEFDLKAVVKKDVPRVEWNTVQRILLEPEDAENIQDRIKQYKFWPFEISVSSRQNNSKQKDKNDESIFIYQCYVDASQLLFPGRTRSRVLAQLSTRNLSEMEEKTGLEQSIFGAAIIDESKNIRNKESIEVLESARKNSQETESSSLPIFAENGDPVLILIEFELYRPFLPARVIEDFTEAIQILKSKPKPKGPIYSYTPDLAQEQYINCIKQLVDVIAENYRDFFEQCECQEKCDSKNAASKCKDKNNASNADEDVTCPYFYIPDELSRFRQFLHETGKYVSIRSTLRNKIINLLDQKFAMNSSEWYTTKNQNFVASCYTYLVEQMHTALNTKLDVRLVEEASKPDSPKELWFRAEEAYEFEDYEKTDKLITKIVCNDRKNADSWVKYAIHFLRRSESAEAIECCREAIGLDSRHKIALLLYGIILAMKEEYLDAEIFLKAVTHFYPRFAEGWAILHLLYIKIQYYPGIDLTLDIAEKCLKDRVREKKALDVLYEEPMAWSAMLGRNNQIFLLTTVLLLKLNLYDFAGLALAQELCHGERSVEFLYFLSVNSYLQKNYEDAIQQLKEAETIIGLEYSIAALMGHSLYKSGIIDEAIEQYESVDMLYDRPESIHLVHLRMGFHYIDIEEYEHARNVFLRACKQSPTCKTWLGVGISSYYLENFEESEIALTEANRIDCEDPEVWAYLCMLSMSLHRYDEFAQCYRMTVKNNLRSDKLWRLITHSMDTLGFSSPITVFENSTDRCVC